MKASLVKEAVALVVECETAKPFILCPRPIMLAKTYFSVLLNQCVAALTLLHPLFCPSTTLSCRRGLQQVLHVQEHRWEWDSAGIVSEKEERDEIVAGPEMHEMFRGPHQKDI